MKKTVRDKFIKVRATDAEKQYASRVSDAVGKDLSEILREAISRLGKRHKVDHQNNGVDA